MYSDLFNALLKLSKTVIANINSYNQIIISGPIDEIDKSIELFKENNIKKIIIHNFFCFIRGEPCIIPFFLYQ